MKIRKVFAAFAALVLAVSANAQDTDYKTLVFVDAKGNVLENGATVTVSETEIHPTFGEVISTGLSIKNTTAEEVGVQVETNISQMDNGEIICCFNGACLNYTYVGTHYNVENTFPASDTKALDTEWKYNDNGNCTATFKLKILSIEYNDWDIPTYSFKADGPSVTVNFVNDPTGIEGVAGDKENKTIKGYYTIDGQRLAAPQKGVNVVKYSNGNSSKIIY